MKKKYIVLLLSLLAIIQACDKIEEPYIKEGNIIWNGRKIIIYDFTGHKCGNCPRAHEKIDQLINLYGDAIVPIAIHATFFAKPATSDTSLPYHYNFRTDIGDFLGGTQTEVGFYGELALPVGLVNNLKPESLKVHDAWGTDVAKYISSFPEFLIEIESNYNQGDSTISAEIEIKTNLNNTRKTSLIVFVLEDHIVNWQTDYQQSPKYLENYEHNHVLRAGMNGAFGEVIKNTNEAVVTGQNWTKNYEIKANVDWEIDNCIVVAFIYDSDTHEVLQAEIKHLSE